MSIDTKDKLILSSIDTVNQNASGMEGSFIGSLHEGGIWNSQGFWQLYDSLNILAENLRKDQSLGRELVGNVSKIHSFALNSVIHHLDKNDLFQIKNLDSNLIRDYLERLNLVMEGFYKGKPVEESMFDDDLREGTFQ